jgi:hypothetical protein
VQIDGDGAKSRSDHAAEDFTLSGFLHPAAARSTAGLRMAEQSDLAAPRDEIFLKMVARILRRVNADGPTAMWTISRGRHLDERVILSRCGAKPPRMPYRSGHMSDRQTRIVATDRAWGCAPIAKV